MTGLTVFLVVMTAAVVVTNFLLGFRLGRDAGQQSEIASVHREAAEARRQLHDLTRQAFVAMTEVASDEWRHRHD